MLQSATKCRQSVKTNREENSINGKRFEMTNERKTNKKLCRKLCIKVESSDRLQKIMLTKKITREDRIHLRITDYLRNGKGTDD